MIGRRREEEDGWFLRLGFRKGIRWDWRCSDTGVSKPSMVAQSASESLEDDTECHSEDWRNALRKR